MRFSVYLMQVPGVHKGELKTEICKELARLLCLFSCLFFGQFYILSLHTYCILSRSKTCSHIPDFFILGRDNHMHQYRLGITCWRVALKRTWVFRCTAGRPWASSVLLRHGQWYPKVHWKEHGQQGEEGNPLSLLCLGEVTFRTL